MAKKPSIYSDTDQRPTQPFGAEQPLLQKPFKPRRRYAHVFSSGRQLKLIRNAKGRPVWRRVPDSSIVFYGKKFTSRRTKIINPETGKFEYKKNDNNE